MASAAWWEPAEPVLVDAVVDCPWTAVRQAAPAVTAARARAAAAAW
jgi:hypothetical protein